MNWKLITTDNATLIERVRGFLKPDYPQYGFEIITGEEKAYTLRCTGIKENDIESIASLFYSLGYYVRMCRE